MFGKITDLLWWVQLLDATTLKNWQMMRDILEECIPPESINGYDWDCALPVSISIMGTSTPMDLQGLMERWKRHICQDEYIALVEFKRGDVLSHNIVTYHIVSYDSIATLDGCEAAKVALEYGMTLPADRNSEFGLTTT